MIEEWRAIPGYEGLYEISNLGRVRGSVRRGTSGSVLSLAQEKNGYTKVSLYKNCKRKIFWLHALILEAFIGPRPLGMQGCHNDGDRSNNVLGNLRWDTPSANYDDARKHGTAAIGDRNPSTKIKVSDRLEIRRLRAEGMVQREIASRFGVCQQTISELLKGRVDATGI